MFYRTAESVSPKHPDKLCDRISDAILDAYLAQDPYSRVAAETCGGHGVVFVTGEITSKGNVNIKKILISQVKKRKQIKKLIMITKRGQVVGISSEVLYFE